MIVTEAWTLSERAPGQTGLATLKRETFAFPDLADDELLVEPLFGCWEGNMAHALRGSPIDLCADRGEPRVVIGNGGVVRVLRPGAAVHDLKEGDVCLLFCNASPDARGLPTRIFGYDAPNTVGLLARQTKVTRAQLIPVPAGSRYALEQWAAFSLRYITAWANWKVAHACWRAMPGADLAPTHVWGWGGGVAFAELQLAALDGCRAAMLASTDERLATIADAGIAALDRRAFGDLHYDADRYAACGDYRRRYGAAERAFLDRVAAETDGHGVSIFIDYIGVPVFRATLKALGRPGVVTSAGWKGGMKLSSVRAIECMSWHTHVHTHYACHADGAAAVSFAAETGWMPPRPACRYGWDDIPQLAADYDAGRIADYFPIYRVDS